MIPNVLEKKRMLEIKTQMELQHFITRKVKCDVSGLSGHQRLFLIEIADRVNHKHSFEKQWRCWPSVEGIGKCIGLGKTKTNEIIGSLCKLGVLEYKKGNSRVGNEYKINVTALGRLVSIDVRYYGDGVQQEKKDDYIPAKSGRCHPDYDEEDGMSFLEKVYV
jgi:hypothetical protein